MPKRNHSEDEDCESEYNMWKQFKRLKRKLKKIHKKRRPRRRHISDTSDQTDQSNISIINEGVEDSLSIFGDLNHITAAATAATPVPGPSESESCAPGAALSPTTTPLVPAAPTHDITTETTGSVEKPPEEDIALSEDILIFLGEAPNKNKKFGPKLQNDVANRWEHVATSGVNKDIRKEFVEKYLTPENCKLIDPPALNLEVKAALSETLLKKDTAIQNKQKQIAAGIACIGQALTRALFQNKDAEMIKLLIDAGRIVCDIQHTESMMRRGFIGSCIKKEVKDHLNDTQIDKFLFGEALAGTLKAAKSINKSGIEIRASASVTRPMLKSKTTRPLNSRPPATMSRLPVAGRRPEEQPPAYPAAHPPPQPPRRRAPPPPPPPPPPAHRSHQRPRAPRR